LFKSGVRGVYHSISTRYLQSYLNEYGWRYNHRHDTKPMFWSILDQVQKRDLAAL
jgi:transposase